MCSLQLELTASLSDEDSAMRPGQNKIYPFTSGLMGAHKEEILLCEAGFLSVFNSN